MAGPCCTYAPVVFKDGKWQCSECSSISEVNKVDGEQLSFDFEYIPGYHYKAKEEKKCECGAHKTKNANCHTFWCPKYEK